MADKPILFSAPMVRALLDGRKTQTRRVLKPQPPEWCAKDREPGYSCLTPKGSIEFRGRYVDDDGHDHGPASKFVRLPAVRGDRLWVREAWWIATRYNYGATPGGCELNPPSLARRSGDPVHYASDGDPPNCANKHYGLAGLRGGSFAASDPYAIWVKRPSIHMPRWASRLTLTVTDVRVERLQDISEEDAIAEGVERLRSGRGFYDPAMSRGAVRLGHYFETAPEAFAALWKSINGPGSWDENPWVVAITFTVRKGNIDQMEANNG